MAVDTLKALVGGAIAFAFLYGVAFAHPSPDCTYIKEQVKQHGIIKAYALALSQGYTPKDIARIRKQCGV